jgi:hypothetical protein
MGLLSNIFGKASAAPIEAVGNVLDGLFTSDEERLDKQALLTKLAQRPNLAQVELNKVEAMHRSTFVAGWRPFIGWVCGFGLANAFLLNPWIEWVAQRTGPNIPMEIMMELVIALLGLGALRTVEKINGRAK